MVVEVCSDLSHLVRNLDPVLAQLGFGTDARKHQQLRGLKGARREDHLAIGGERPPAVERVDVDRDRASPIENDAQGSRVGLLRTRLDIAVCSATRSASCWDS